MLAIYISYVYAIFDIVGVGPITILNRDPSEFDSFIAAVQALSANGGGDTPEFALDGMLQGLQATQVINGVTTDLMTAGSQMIVLTDAPSLRPEITDTVISEANTRGVCIHFFISFTLSDTIYQRIADETSGILVEDFTNFQLANFIADTAVTPCGFINVQSTGSSSSSEETFDISTITVLLQLSIGASSGATVTITRPDSSSAAVVASQGFAVFSESSPQAGMWSVSVNFGTVQISVIRRTVIDTTFVYSYVSEGSSEVTLVPRTQNCMLH